MRVKEIRGLHGAVLEVADPEREARRWTRALGLSVLRRNGRETVLGSLSCFVVLRRTAPGRERVVELHVAARGLSGARLVVDDLGGRHAEAELGGVRLVVRELVDPPAPSWRPRPRRRGRRGPPGDRAKRRR